MLKMSIKTVALTAMLSAAIGFAAADSADAKKEFEYLPGDFHQHTLYTDGSDPFFEVMDSNPYYGLEWWANSEHGGRRNRDRPGETRPLRQPPRLPRAAL